MYISRSPDGMVFVGRFLTRLLKFYNGWIAGPRGKLDYKSVHRHMNSGTPYKGVTVRRLNGTGATEAPPRGLVVRM